MRYLGGGIGHAATQTQLLNEDDAMMAFEKPVLRLDGIDARDQSPQTC
jgi:hypothetical protein